MIDEQVKFAIMTVEVYRLIQQHYVVMLPVFDETRQCWRGLIRQNDADPYRLFHTMVHYIDRRNYATWYEGGEQVV